MTKCIPIKNIVLDDKDVRWLNIEYEDGGKVQILLHGSGIKEANKFFKEVIECRREG